MKKFETLLKSEIKKAERCANKALKCNDCRVTGYFSDGTIDELGFITVTCEICHDYEARADVDVEMNIFIPDRRRSWAVAKDGKSYLF